MIKIKMELKKGDFGFDAVDEGGHILTTDSSVENGGEDYGFRPMQLLLAALGSCSAIDIVSIIKKQRQKIDTFRMTIEGEREAGKVPALWKTAHIDFDLTGEIDPGKTVRACALSIDKYCSVAETLRRAGATITWQLTVNNNIISQRENANEPNDAA